MADVIIVMIVLAAFAAAVTYIIKAKKRGVKCIGCSAGDTCGSKGNPSGSCACMENVDALIHQIKIENNIEKK